MASGTPITCTRVGGHSLQGLRPPWNVSWHGRPSVSPRWRCRLEGPERRRRTVESAGRRHVFVDRGNLQTSLVHEPPPISGASSLSRPCSM